MLLFSGLFHINSTVTSRYATTVITSRVANRMDQSKEIEFHVRIPKNAFISKFRMFMDGEVYDGVVKAKEQAERQYTTAVSRGQSAGIVSSVGRTLEEFKTSVTVAAHKKVTFELTYEELLKRRLGKYELQIFARPMQPVKDFKIDVHINEDAGLKFIESKGGLSTKELANAITKTVTDKQAWVYFYPTVDQQKVCDSCSDDGLNGDLVIFYDVKREVSFGDIQTGDGYFVHHFAPSSLPRIPKNVVFVIDQSGSMHGRKMQQTRIALIHILSDLAEDDFFGLITFDSDIFHWKRELVQATSINIEQAKRFAENIQDRGSTDINRAVLEGTRMLNVHPREDSASILILLTDGDPTSGEINPQKIRANVKRAIAGKFPLYCLGFGFDVNFEILEKMSLDNNGLARRIYEDSDADLQLQGFYEEVATPLLTDVTMIYTGGSNLTQTNFSQYYNGSEIVVAGVITDNNIESFIPEVVAVSVSIPNTTTESTVTAPVDRIQRVWAYLTVKQLLEKKWVTLQLSGPEKDKVKKEAMDLSLKYNFVTPLTSMVVTKPPGEDSAVLNKPKEGEQPALPRGAGQLPALPRGAGQRPPLPGLAGQLPPLLGGAGQGRPLHDKWSHLCNTFLPSRGFHAKQNKNVEIFVCRNDLMQHFENHNTGPVSPAPQTQRFLLKPENMHFPICFDLPTNINVKILHLPSRGHVTVIIRDKEIDVSVGDVRLVILVHEISGRKFLWPVFRQMPQDDTAEGVFGECAYSDCIVPVPVSVECWFFFSAQSALQRPTTDLYN
uniref:Uncharacterized protein n=1 Tax=Periophthalmus magnuspinnatus TaxID=409849 RepID=A0A3B3ZEV5_9GOBI